MLGDLRRNLAGAWDVLLGRRRGLAKLDLSIEGFWRSFAALVLVIPFIFLALLSQQRLAHDSETPEADALADGVGLEAIAQLVDWIAFPIVFAGLARPLGLAARYVPFIVARNWSAVIISAIIAVVHAAHVVGILPSSLAPMFLLVTIAIALRFAYVIARTTLDVSVATAIGIVALDFLISLLIWSAAERFS
jgi:hypothetical protein